MIHQIPFSRAFQYSLLVHVVFVAILVVSWEHKVEPEPVQVALWSRQEVVEARHTEKSMTVTKKTSHAIPKLVKPKVDEEKPERVPFRPLTRIPKVIPKPVEKSVPDEDADIQIERKRTQKRVEKKEPKEPLPLPEKRELKKVPLKKVKEATEPIEQEKPKYRPVPHKLPPQPRSKTPPKESQVKVPVPTQKTPLPSQKMTDTEADDKADWIENQMNTPASPSRSASASGAAGASGGSASAGKKGVDCSQLGSFCSTVRLKVKGNLEWSDNQEVSSPASFEVQLFPNGDIRRISLKKSSGTPAFDRAVEQAIRASAPFPKPQNVTALLNNTLTFRYALHD